MERMRRGLHQGLSAAQAAQAALATTSPPGRTLEDARALLLGAIESSTKPGFRSLWTTRWLHSG